MACYDGKNQKISFYLQARQFAAKHGIELLDETNLIKKLNDSSLAYSREISKLFASEQKFCPKCEKKMVVRTAEKTGNQFWGCSTFPQCHFTMEYANGSAIVSDFTQELQSGCNVIMAKRFGRGRTGS